MQAILSTRIKYTDENLKQCVTYETYCSPSPGPPLLLPCPPSPYEIMKIILDIDFHPLNVHNFPLTTPPCPSLCQNPLTLEVKFRIVCLVLQKSFTHGRARAYCTCSGCGWGLFGHFYSHLSFLSSFSLSLGDGPI